MTTVPLSFEPEWLSVEGVTSPKLAATWCRLVIRVDEQAVTRVEDLDGRTSRQGIFVSAYPLAEWIATHWWMLRSHVRGAAALEVASVGSRALSRMPLSVHDMRSAGDGFFWPTLLILPEGQNTLLSWTPDRSPLGGRIRFVSTGRVWAASDAVQTSLASFVESVLDRLIDMGVRGTLLEEEWTAVSAADVDEARFCDTAAALGVDPYDVPEELARRIETLDALTSPGLVGELASAADPNRLSDDFSWVNRALVQLEQTRSADTSSSLAQLHQAMADRDDTSSPPWDVGWRQAASVRSLLVDQPTDRISLDGLVGHGYVASNDSALQGLGSAREGQLKLVLGSKSSPTAQRFLDARTLWRGLNTVDRPYLLTTAGTYDQRVERAFAAAAPSPGLWHC